jgi:hypothetical protein
MSAARTQNSAERFHGRSRSEKRSCSCASGNGIAGGLRSRTRPSRSLEEEGGGLQKREMCVHTASGLLRQWPLSRPRVALALSGGGRPGIEPCAISVRLRWSTMNLACRVRSDRRCAYARHSMWRGDEMGGRRRRDGAPLHGSAVRSGRPSLRSV